MDNVNLINFLEGRKFQSGNVSKELFDGLSLLGNMKDIYRKGDKIKIFRKNGDKFITEDVELANKEYNEGSTVYFITSRYLKDYFKSKVLLNKNFFNVRFSIFYSKAGTTIPLHWDFLHNLTIQIIGKKKWWYGECEGIENPLFNFAVGESIIDENVCIPHLYELNESILERSCFLYLPRGYWHKTETHEDSCSISINVEPTTITSVIQRNIVSHYKKYSSLRRCYLSEGKINRSELNSIFSDIRNILAEEELLDD